MTLPSRLETCAGSPPRAGVRDPRAQFSLSLAGRGGAGAGTEYKFMCGLSQARGPTGRVRAWFRGPRSSLLRTQDSKFEHWRSDAELATSRSWSPQYWIFTSEQGRNILFLWNLNARTGFDPTISDFPSRSAPSTTALEPPCCIPAGERSSQWTQLMDTRRWTNVDIMLSQFCKCIPMMNY